MARGVNDNSLICGLIILLPAFTRTIYISVRYLCKTNTNFVFNYEYIGLRATLSTQSIWKFAKKVGMLSDNDIIANDHNISRTDRYVMSNITHNTSNI